jgi:FG-GAP repeat
MNIFRNLSGSLARYTRPYNVGVQLKRRLDDCLGPAIVLSMLALGACGGGGGGDNPAPTPPPQVMAPTTAASATLSFDTKTFRFTWTDVADATHYRLVENPDGNSGFSQVGDDITQGTQTVDHIVPLYNRVNASYILQSCNSGGCTDSSPVNITGNLIDAIGYFKASNTGQSDVFGASVSLSGDGSTLAVGASLEDSNTSGINTVPNDDSENAGAVYVFTRNGSAWTQQAYIKPSHAGVSHYFGVSVSLSADGNTVAVGASGEATGTGGINVAPDIDAPGSGAAYVFTRNDSTWSEQAFIKASNTGENDAFGYSLSLSAEGNSLAVGAYREDSSTQGIDTTPNNLANDAGAVYVYSRSGSTWSEQSYIKSSNGELGDLFGYSVSISDDGNTLAVGASGEDSNMGGINATANEGALNSGAAYVFSRSGSSWSEQAYIKASNPDENDQFFSLSLSGDGNTLAVGAFFESSSTTGVNTTPDNLAKWAGAAYVYSRTGSTWSEQAYLKPSFIEAGDELGRSLSLSTDGNTLAVGAIFESSSTSGLNTTPNNDLDSGAVYMYSRNGGTWTEQTYVKSSNPGQFDHFYKVSLSGDGNTLAVGVTEEGSDTTGINSTPNELADNAGAVYVY